MALEMLHERFNKFDEQYHKWYSRFEAEDGFKQGALVRYIGINEKNKSCIEFPQYCGDAKAPRDLLTPGELYEVEYRLLGRSWQVVKLTGFPYGIEFSPSVFEVVDKNAAGRLLKRGGRVRYIGPKDPSLAQGSIYEVEGLTFDGFGYVYVKLLGHEKLYERAFFERAAL